MPGAYVGGKFVRKVDKFNFGYSYFELYELLIKYIEDKIRELPVYRWKWSLWIGCMHVGVGSNIWFSLKVKAVEAYLNVVGIEPNKKNL